MRYIKIIFAIFCTTLFTDEIDLKPYEAMVYSQHGEDGVVAKLLSVIPTTSRYCVEFGAYDGITGSNTFLLRRQGWKALLLDRMFEKPEYNLHKEFIRAETINSIFEKYKVPYDLDLLSIDIDYNDFYVWNALDDKFQAKIVIIECNPTHLPTEDKVVKYRPHFCGDGTNYYGASILALYNLGRKKGYSLVYHDSSGTNLFFVKNEILEKFNLHFKNMNDVEALYNAANYNLGPNGGHRIDAKKRAYLTSEELLNEGL